MKETKVLSITEIIEESSLPDGEHEGVWGAYLVKLKVNGHYYELRTENGIRTMAAPCVVTAKDGKATVRTK